MRSASDSSSPTAAKPLLTQEDEEKEEAQAAADSSRDLASSLPWTLQATAEWTSADDVASTTTPQYLLRGTESLDVDDEDEEGDAKAEAQQLHFAVAAESHEAPLSMTTSAAMASHHLAEGDYEAVNGKKPGRQPSPLAHPNGSSSARDSAAGSLADHARAYAEVSAAPAGYVPMDPRSPTPPQSPHAGAPYPLYVFDPTAHAGSPPSLPSPSHPSMPLPPNQLLYYTVANGVPMLVQPPTTPGGVAMIFPLSGPVASGDPNVPTYAASLAAQQIFSAAPQGGVPFAVAPPSSSQAGPQSAIFSSSHATPASHPGLQNAQSHKGNASSHAGGSSPF